MLDLARRDSQNPRIRAIAGQLHTASYNHSRAVPGNGAGNVDPASLPDLEYARRVWQFARDRVRFVRDIDTAAALPIAAPEEAEVLIAPRDLVRMAQPAGDCDDFSMLVAALLLAGGVDSSFVAVAADGSAPDRFSHVYVVAHTGAGDLPLDASHGSFAGWEAAGTFRKRAWRLPRMIVPSGFSGLGFQTPTFSTTVTAQAPTWWETALSRTFDTIQQRLQRPTYQSRGPSGEVIIHAPGPAGQNLPSPTTAGGAVGAGIAHGYGASSGITTNMLMLGALGLVTVMMLSRKN